MDPFLWSMVDYTITPRRFVLPNLSKLEPLDDTNYHRWASNMLIFFEQLDVDYMLFQEESIDFSIRTIIRLEDTSQTTPQTPYR